MSLDWQALVPTIAHDARAFVRRGITQAQLLERLLDSDANSEASTYLKNIIDSQRDLNRFLGRLVTLAEAQATDLPEEMLELNVIVLGAKLECKNAIQTAGGELVIGDLPSRCLLRRTQLVLKEFLDNCARFADVNRPLRINIEAIAVDDVVRVSVADNGTGINPDYATRLFQPLKRLDATRSGDGLGLAIAKGIVNGCRGRIFYEQTSLGARFAFEVPALPV